VAPAVFEKDARTVFREANVVTSNVAAPATELRHRRILLAGRDPHDTDGVADHIGGALLILGGLAALKSLPQGSNKFTGCLCFSDLAFDFANSFGGDI
jgi:hypothetical protein